MSLARALLAVGLIRPTRRRGFCPACRGWAAPKGGTRTEIAPPAVISLAFLVVAAVAWWLTIEQSRSMSGMTMDLGTPGSFAVTWGVMMAAMMLPTAVPLVFEFGRSAEGRPGWQAATGLLGLSYLSVWLAFGLICYVGRSALPMSMPNQRLVGLVALVLAGLYALTPIKRSSEARCRELCALHGSLPFNLMRSALVVGVKYGLSCIGCSAGLMVAMVIIGMSNLAWIFILSGVVLVYKLAPEARTRRTLLLSGALGALGVVYALVT